MKGGLWLLYFKKGMYVNLKGWELGALPLAPCPLPLRPSSGWAPSSLQGYPRPEIQQHPFVHLAERGTVKVKYLAQKHSTMTRPWV